ncbi:hypothetical protein OG429_40175 (plasmid) [Streptomyces sp. NBC_00190]|uniref:hypothetical protein n=1 Tax=unclassified Streptomyces TaxID=2593676 RepID=UPI002E2D75B4|nr:hypothetical protein [Streptomyces sp. NBC_00190]WSZ45816.1 hypothetical protein OG239_44435 [Streptomyces sp. NBC_00868]
MAKKQKLPFPVAVVTVDSPQQARTVASSWIVWGGRCFEAGGALSSLSVSAAELGAHEVIGARVTAIPGISYTSLVAYGTAITYR